MNTWRRWGSPSPPCTWIRPASLSLFTPHIGFSLHQYRHSTLTPIPQSSTQFAFTLVIQFAVASLLTSLHFYGPITSHSTLCTFTSKGTNTRVSTHNTLEGGGVWRTLLPPCGVFLFSPLPSLSLHPFSSVHSSPSFPPSPDSPSYCTCGGLTWGGQRGGVDRYRGIGKIQHLQTSLPLVNFGIEESIWVRKM